MKRIFNIISVACLGIMGLALTACNSEGDDFDYKKSGLFFSGTEVTPVVVFGIEDTPASFPVTVQSTKKVDSDVTLTLAIDPAKVDEYNQVNTTSYFALPEGAVELENPVVTISKGNALSSAATVRILSTEDFEEGRTYMIPVTVKNVVGTDEPFIETSNTIYLRISRTISFFSIQANTNAQSSYIFDEIVAPLTTFTYEIKVYPQDLHRGTNYPQKLMSLCEADESHSANLRFNEANDQNKLQVLLDGNKWLSNLEFENNHWYMLSVVSDGTTMALYINGVIDSSISASVVGGLINFQRYEMGMSWNGDNGNHPSRQFFAHRFCELRIWDRALTPSEMQGGLCGVDPNSNGLKAYWKFNEGEGHIFHDATGRGFDIDWTKSAREKSSTSGWANTPEAANYITWVKDDINKCTD